MTTAQQKLDSVTKQRTDAKTAVKSTMQSLAASTRQPRDQLDELKRVEYTAREAGCPVAELSAVVAEVDKLRSQLLRTLKECTAPLPAMLDLNALDSAIKAADGEVSASELKSARHKLQSVKVGREHAARQLQTAMSDASSIKVGTAGGLVKAIPQAVDFGVSASSVESARQKLQAIVDASGKRLKSASSSGAPGFELIHLLRQALDDAKVVNAELRKTSDTLCPKSIAEDELRKSQEALSKATRDVTSTLLSATQQAREELERRKDASFVEVDVTVHLTFVQIALTYDAIEAEASRVKSKFDTMESQTTSGGDVKYKVAEFMRPPAIVQGREFLPRRQDILKLDEKAFAPPDEVFATLAGNKKRPRRVITLSHGWRMDGRPDPDGLELERIRRWLKEERPNQKTMGIDQFFLFYDWASAPQPNHEGEYVDEPTDEGTKQMQQDRFNNALGDMTRLYASIIGTSVLRLAPKAMPPPPPDVFEGVVSFLWGKKVLVIDGRDDARLQREAETDLVSAIAQASKNTLTAGRDFDILAVGAVTKYRGGKRKINVRFASQDQAVKIFHALGFKVAIPGYNDRTYAMRKFCMHETCSAALTEALIRSKGAEKQVKQIEDADKVLPKLINISYGADSDAHQMQRTGDDEDALKRAEDNLNEVSETPLNDDDELLMQLRQFDEEIKEAKAHAGDVKSQFKKNQRLGKFLVEERLFEESCTRPEMNSFFFAVTELPVFLEEDEERQVKIIGGKVLLSRNEDSDTFDVLGLCSQMLWGALWKPEASEYELTVERVEPNGRATLSDGRKKFFSRPMEFVTEEFKQRLAAEVLKTMGTSGSSIGAKASRQEAGTVSVHKLARIKRDMQFGNARRSSSRASDGDDAAADDHDGQRLLSSGSKAGSSGFWSWVPMRKGRVVQIGDVNVNARHPSSRASKASVLPSTSAKVQGESARWGGSRGSRMLGLGGPSRLQREAAREAALRRKERESGGQPDALVVEVQ